MSDSAALPESPPSQPTESETIDLDLLPWQHDSIYNIDQYPIVYLSGGRGSGKSYTDTPRVIRWSELATDVPIGVFAPTIFQLNTVMAPIMAMFEAMGYDHVYGPQAPEEWRQAWRAAGIGFPPRRLRNINFVIIEDGTHIYTGSLLQGAATRAKSIDFNAILIQEGTEPGVTEDAINTLTGNLRCGKARQQPDGTYRCQEPGHIHQLVYAFNVPLNDPSHFIYNKAARLEQVNAKLAKQGRPPVFRLIESATQDNPLTGRTYIDLLAAALDEDTFIQQTSGRLKRNQHATSYYAFSDEARGNVLPSLTYDWLKDLHIWFDFNAAPGTAGWGHDLTYDEVHPYREWREGYDYFGIIGELHSGSETMQTEQVANALLGDPREEKSFKKRICKDCPHAMGEHMELPDSYLCQHCRHETRRGVFCSGNTVDFDDRSSPMARKFIHAVDGWRGLMRHRGKIFVYGDASGKQTHADSSVIGGSRQILRNVFDANLGERVFYRFREANPAINKRVAAVNRAFCDARGIRSTFVHPICTAHLADFREVIPGPDGDPLKKTRPTKPTADTYWQRTHSSDGWGYHVDYRWPFQIPRADGMPDITPASPLPPFGSLGAKP